MSKEKFYYDCKTGTYVRIDEPFVKRFKKVVIILSTVSILGITFAYIFSNNRSTPVKTASLVSNNNSETELNKMVGQYEALNEKLEKANTVLDNLQERDNHLYRTYFELSPISDEVRKGGFGGTDRYKDLKNLSKADLVIKTSKKVDMLSKQLLVQSKSIEEIAKRAKEKEKMLASIPAIQPIAKNKLKRLASGYGMRRHPILKIGKMHWGLDFSANTGTPIYATGDATVKSAGRMGGYGNVVVLDHGYGYETYYAHMSKFGKYQKGQKVKRGDIIGYVGSTGLSSGPHLHYEIHKDGEKIDPISFFYKNVSPDEYKKLHDQAQEAGQSMD
ncbi:MAG: peptidoglycan DD-metalloendopeptidase family protein [Flavobacteriales bacterium]